MILFTKPNCQKCEYVKRFIKDKSTIQILDITSMEGLSELAMHGLVNLSSKTLPILVDNNKIIVGASLIRTTILGEKTYD